MQASDVTRQVRAFIDEGDEAAMKSRELILLLLQCGASPFSRSYFTPGHITGTATVLTPDLRQFLLVHHRRLDRWLLPGGHIELEDDQVWDTARREAVEETGVEIVGERWPRLVGMDVHGIPAKGQEPYHLHHDLVYRFIARGVNLRASAETREVRWATLRDFDRYQLPVSIRRSILRAIWH